MASLAEDFAYFLVNPSAPYFAEGEQMITFWGLSGVIELLGQANLLNHADILALPDTGFNSEVDADYIWDTMLKGQTFHGVTFREYRDVDETNSDRVMYVAVKL
jgi:hypothetical protein